MFSRKEWKCNSWIQVKLLFLCLVLGPSPWSSPRCTLSTHRQVCLLAAGTASVDVCVTHSMWTSCDWMAPSANRRVSACPQLRGRKMGTEAESKGRKHWMAALGVPAPGKQRGLMFSWTRKQKKPGTAWRKESAAFRCAGVIKRKGFYERKSVNQQ